MTRYACVDQRCPVRAPVEAETPSVCYTCGIPMAEAVTTLDWAFELIQQTPEQKAKSEQFMAWVAEQQRQLWASLAIPDEIIQGKPSCGVFWR